MRTPFFAAVLLIGGSLALASCDTGSNTANTTNRPANAGNSAANANASSAANPAATEADVKKLLSDLAAVLAKNDVDAAARFYSDDYRLITPAGVVQNKSERLADMRSGATKFNTFAYEDVEVRSFGDTAIAISNVRATGTAAGAAVPNIRATLVLRRMPDGWKVVSGQATPITGTAAPAGNTNTAAATNTNAAANSNR